MPKVSVIVPSYNLEKYLGETLQSVVNQTFTDWECIVVENASTDGSLALAQGFAAKDARFKLLPLPENQGVAGARNRGIGMAAGEYLLFLDADDLIAPHYMADAVAALEADPSLTVVYGKATRFGAETRWELPPFSMSTMLSSNCLYISCFVRKEILRSAQNDSSSAQNDRCHPEERSDEGSVVAFDPAFKAGYEDWDFWLSVLELVPSPKVLQLDSLCFFYRTRRKSRNRGVTDQALREIRYRLWEKHKALYARYFPNPLETVEYRRLERAYKKAARMPLWRIRTALKKLLGVR